MSYEITIIERRQITREVPDDARPGMAYSNLPPTKTISVPDERVVLRQVFDSLTKSQIHQVIKTLNEII